MTLPREQPNMSQKVPWQKLGSFSPAQKMEHFYWVTWAILPSLRNREWQVHGFILSEKNYPLETQLNSLAGAKGIHHGKLTF